MSDAVVLLNTRQADLPAQLAVAPDGVVHELLNRLGQTQVLLVRASDAGISLAEEHLDSLDFVTRQGLILATDQLGIRSIPVSAGETAHDAIARRILQILREVTAGTLNAIPMGAISLTLRRELDWDILDSSIGATVERVDDLRGSTQVAPLQPAVPPPVGAPPAGAPPAGAPPAGAPAAGTPPVLDSVQN